MARKVIKTTEREILDKETGELVQVANEKVFAVDVPNDKFFMVYIENLASFYKIKSSIDKNVIIWMCEHAEYNTNKVRLTSSDRKQMCEDLDIKNSGLSLSLKRLKENGLITGEGGMFEISPELFWKGDSLTRKKKITIEFNTL
jgi:hypothetical protein